MLPAQRTHLLTALLPHCLSWRRVAQLTKVRRPPAVPHSCVAAELALPLHELIAVFFTCRRAGATTTANKFRPIGLFPLNVLAVPEAPKVRSGTFGAFVEVEVELCVLDGLVVEGRIGIDQCITFHQALDAEPLHVATF